MSLYPTPEVVHAEHWLSVPSELRKADSIPGWSHANRGGQALECFLEGPVFDDTGHLWLTDIPYGRIFRVTPDGVWEVMVEYDGWPNGLAVHPDGRIYIADYRQGILVLDTETLVMLPVVEGRHSEHFRGCNDLIVNKTGTHLYFTDQGQSGMHMPNGRVYRYGLLDGRLDLLIETGPSPNGLMLNESESVLYVAMTRANAIWRLPLMNDGTVSKAGVFIQLSGGLGGPDGMERGLDDTVHVAHVGNGCVWSFDRSGIPTQRVMCAGEHVTNLTFSPQGRMVITESGSGDVYRY